ncbi:MAG: carboxypeptidase regulatory-like domain-containing protein, partial [Gammaproteobacteria bacterium]|nr:carboxypeptidase regulatory-like domain-containing protein [Gammaproteobacteria bacterium]
TSFSWANVTTHLISGTVLDASGTAVTDQLVSAFSNNASAYQSVITDSNGAYEFKALTPASDYVVDAWTVDGHLEVTGVDISTADATGTTLQPVSSGRHDLTITTGTGMGIVGLFDASGTFVQAGVADASGTLQFKGLDDTTSYTIKLDANMDGDYADTDGSDTSAVHSSGTTLQF